MPEGEKASKKVVDNALYEETGRGKKEKVALIVEPVAAVQIPASVQVTEATVAIPPCEDEPIPPVVTTSSQRTKVNPGKVKLVAELLGLSDENEEDILVRLIDEFLALKAA